MAQIFKILQEATERLGASNIDTPKLDAEVLLANVLRIKRVDLTLKRDKAITDEQHARFNECIDERVRRRPVSQIVGMREFWSLPIMVNEHVLTPRPETEGIVEFALGRFPRDARLDVLDLCTGSGCIAAAIASEFSNARITATDISSKALDVARKNLAFASNRAELLQGNLFDVFERRTTNDERRLFDLIVSNPPYIADEEYQTLPPEVRDYEPREALTAGRDGLAILKKIAQYAPRYINSGGWLVVEFGMGQARAVSEMLIDSEQFGRIEIRRDLAGIERIVAGQKK